MTITHGWYNDEKTIILTTIEGDWTWEEIVSIFEQMPFMLDEVTHKVTHIGDYRKAKPLTKGIVARMPVIASVSDHNNFNVFIMVGVKGRFIESASRIFKNVYGNLHTVDTMEEALAIAIG